MTRFQSWLAPDLLLGSIWLGMGVDSVWISLFLFWPRNNPDFLTFGSKSLHVTPPSLTPHATARGGAGGARGAGAAARGDDDCHLLFGTPPPSPLLSPSPRFLVVAAMSCLREDVRGGCLNLTLQPRGVWAPTPAADLDVVLLDLWWTKNLGASWVFSCSIFSIVGGFRIELNKVNAFRLSCPSQAIQKPTTKSPEQINFLSPFTCWLSPGTFRHLKGATVRKALFP
jgi:hypothetical protein